MCIIGKVEALIEASIASCTPVSLKICFIPGDPRMEKIEVMLNLWTKDKQRNKKTPSMQGTCHRARRILQDIVSEIEVGPASKIPGARDGLRNSGCTMTGTHVPSYVTVVQKKENATEALCDLYHSYRRS